MQTEADAIPESVDPDAGNDLGSMETLPLILDGLTETALTTGLTAAATLILLLLALVIGYGAACVLHWLLWPVVVGAAKRTKRRTPVLLIEQLRLPVLAGLTLLGVTIALIWLGLRISEEGTPVLARCLRIAGIAIFTWAVISVMEVIEQSIKSRFDVNKSDNLRERKVHTQTSVVVRSLQILAVIIGLAAILMLFPGVERIGQSLLASAGIGALVIGLAARSVFANLIAGLQIAITQPIRLDDVVIVEGEWGRIAEITSTYVVVRIWDDRRLIVPLSYFIEQPFQNWTRTTSHLLGTVFLYTDYTVPIDAMRAELRRLVEADANWDQRVCLIQVTNATESTIEARALVSAGASGALWDLRCQIREGLIRWLQQNHPTALPRTRVLMQPTDSPTHSTPSPENETKILEAHIEENAGGAGTLHEVDDVAATPDNPPASSSPDEPGRLPDGAPPPPRNPT